MSSIQARVLFILSSLTFAAASILPRQYPCYGRACDGDNPDNPAGSYPFSSGGQGGIAGAYGTDASEFFNGHHSHIAQNYASLSQNDKNRLASINFHTVTMARTAHAALACTAIVFFFPVGAVIMRVLPGRLAVWGHVVMQMIGYFLYVAAVGMGIYVATEVKLSTLDYFTKPHPIIGLILFGLVLLQPLGGALHHIGYKKTSGRTFVSHIHIWLGRIIITVGIINGGLGLRLADNASKGQIAAYGVVGGIMWLAVMIAGFGLGRGKQESAPTKEFIDGPLDEDEDYHTGANGFATPETGRRGFFGRFKKQRPVVQTANGNGAAPAA